LIIKPKSHKTVNDINKLSREKQLSFYKNVNYFEGITTPEDIFVDLNENETFAKRIEKAKKTKDNSYIDIWQKIWLEANYKNLYMLLEARNLESNTDTEWDEFQSWFFEKNKTQQTTLDEKEINKIKSIAKISESLSIKEDFMNLFNQRSYENQIIGECIFYAFIMVLLRKRGVKILTKNTLLDELIMPLPVFVMQQSGSGKDQALDFLKELIDEVNKLIINNKKLTKEQKHKLKIIYEELSGGESPEVYFDRPKLNSNGQIKFKNHIMECITGKLARNDLLLVRECSFLFRQKSQERQNVLEILLQTLEGRSISKELVGWDGHALKTQANCAYIGCSRPVNEVKSIITNSGLLQRGLFYGRDISAEERSKMDKIQLNIKIDKPKFITEFTALSKTIFDFYMDVNKNKFILQPNELIKKIIYDYKINKRKYINDEIVNNLLKDVLNTFINRTDDIVMKMAYVNCYARGGDTPEEFDVQQALMTLEKIFNHLIIWLEDKMENKQQTHQYQQLNRQLQKYFEGVHKMKRADIINAIRQITGVSYPTAKKRLKEQFTGKSKLFKQIGEKLYEFN
jgi:hypothetical protein